jgi:uncharacterized alkaline shock family protein YloU
VTRGEASISNDVVARYAADAARDAPGVLALVESHLHRHRGVRVLEDDDGLRVELHLAVEWGSSIPDVGREVQRRVREYLGRMAGVDPLSVDVVADEVGAPS